MQKQFEYKPFDRVTVKDSTGKLSAAVILKIDDLYHSATLWCNNVYNGLLFLELFEIQSPGHYDTDGNWLSQPGEPCHIILANGSPKNMVVVSGEAHYVAAIGEYDTEKTVYFKRALGFVDADFDFDECSSIPQSAILYPGRIKITK